tara:strand:- start:91 stop:231 length:141 start_codon:yes stop_codon:yes gene_type:complete
LEEWEECFDECSELRLDWEEELWVEDRFGDFDVRFELELEDEEDLL